MRIEKSGKKSWRISFRSAYLMPNIWYDLSAVTDVLSYAKLQPETEEGVETEGNRSISLHSYSYSIDVYPRSGTEVEKEGIDLRPKSKTQLMVVKLQIVVVVGCPEGLPVAFSKINDIGSLESKNELVNKIESGKT